MFRPISPMPPSATTRRPPRGNLFGRPRRSVASPTGCDAARGERSRPGSDRRLPPPLRLSERDDLAGARSPDPFAGADFPDDFSGADFSGAAFADADF
ncbi:hypothetical protein ASG12_10515 [Williamsia sp. Leaf354]|nr:hypothetical protein ASG12_10515 [Williamsia sp. Leaf354]